MLGFALGWAGLTLVFAVLLVVGINGNWKIKLSDDAVVVVAFLTGQAAANAGQTFAFVADVSGGLSDAIRDGFGTTGNVTSGAVAIIMCLVIYGMKPNKWRNMAFALCVPAMFTAAGQPFTFVTNTLNGFLGVVA